MSDSCYNCNQREIFAPYSERFCHVCDEAREWGYNEGFNYRGKEVQKLQREIESRRRHAVELDLLNRLHLLGDELRGLAKLERVSGIVVDGLWQKYIRDLDWDLCTERVGETDE